MTWRPRGKLVLAALYGVLLLASHVTGACRGPGRPEPGEVAVRLARIDGERSGDRDVRMVLFDLAPERAAGTEPVVLLHGSPGSKRDLGALAERLANRRRVLVPDLPGFGASDRDLPDYSAAAGADYVADMLRQLGVERAHVVGFSMGGVVAVELLQREPSAVASLTLLSATGVQELELLGEYRLNHLVHGAQLALLWIAQHGLPHFGAWDDAYLDVAYARNFFDTDPRGVRGALSHWDGPTLIVHGRNDVLVPIEAAREHRRIVPHSDLRELDANHFLPFTKPGIVAGLLDSFFDRVHRRSVSRASSSAMQVCSWPGAGSGVRHCAGRR